MPIPINSDDNLWTNINVDETENFLRRFRRTACPVQGDDDIDDDDVEPGDNDVPDDNEEDDKDESPDA
jgi:hypothetical protein